MSVDEVALDREVLEPPTALYVCELLDVLDPIVRQRQVSQLRELLKAREGTQMVMREEELSDVLRFVKG